MAKRGRPKKPDAKRDTIHFRIGEKESNMLTKLSGKTGQNRTDIFVGLLEREYKRVVEENKED